MRSGIQNLQRREQDHGGDPVVGQFPQLGGKRELIQARKRGVEEEDIGYCSRRQRSRSSALALSVTLMPCTCSARSRALRLVGFSSDIRAAIASVLVPFHL